MTARLRWVGFLALALGLPALAEDKPSSVLAPPPAKSADQDLKHKYTTVGQMSGKLDKISPATSEMTIEHTVGLGKYAKKEKADLTLADGAKVFTVKPPEKVDDNGDRKKMSQAELDKIKVRSGDAKGMYAVDLAYLHPGQQIQVTIGKPKDSGPKKPASKDKAGEKEFTYVTQIVITVDADAPKPDKKK